MLVFVGVAVVAVCLVLGVAVLTGIGSYRRGTRPPLSVLAGTDFPATWTVGHVHDEQPYHRSQSHRLDRC